MDLRAQLKMLVLAYYPSNELVKFWFCYVTQIIELGIIVITRN